jgi:hypothetical protein
MTPSLVFISYCHEEKEYKDELCAYLKKYEMNGQLEVFSDDQIETGADWNKSISTAIEEAHLVILLLTTNFLNADYILQVELPLIRHRCEHEGLKLFPILADACPFEQTWVAGRQIRSENGRPIWSLDKEDRITALLNIARKVASLVEKPPPPQPPPAESPPKRDVTVGRTSHLQSPPRKKPLWYALVLFALVLGVWVFTSSITLWDVDTPLSSVPILSVRLSSNIFLSPEENEELRFNVRNDDGLDHHAQLLLRPNGKVRCPVAAGSSTIHDGVVKSQDQFAQALQVKCEWRAEYFGKPQPAGLGLEGKIDDSPFEREQLPLYIAPIPYVRKIQCYLNVLMVAACIPLSVLLIRRAL